jgi:hypothetical protein
LKLQIDDYDDYTNQNIDSFICVLKNVKNSITESPVDKFVEIGGAHRRFSLYDEDGLKNFMINAKWLYI